MRFFGRLSSVIWKILLGLFWGGVSTRRTWLLDFVLTLISLLRRDLILLQYGMLGTRRERRQVPKRTRWDARPACFKQGDYSHSDGRLFWSSHFSDRSFDHHAGASEFSSRCSYDLFAAG